MKLLITRPVVVTVEGSTRSFVPGLTVEVDTPLAQHILDQQSGRVGAVVCRGLGDVGAGVGAARWVEWQEAR